ncbi:50S ribosomal protein L25 [Geobacter sp. AOG1]|uniref:50S ribosomal protein L25 n=1 Tax=Geobacter sp. AOG1 TaxID=1566346 RepID=UPI001CC698CD|nr:50S ribosomal protein L25 [Geobacter sp. AOG1]GFE56384.1 50S ribosomal protein L25 [Geobacter sp. AOG1]
MEQRELTIELRTETGKNACRQLRSKDLIPGVVYGKGMEAVAITVKPKELDAAIAGEGGRNHLISLKGGGSLNGSMVIVADLLRDALRRDVQHVDLHKVNLTEKVRVEVVLNLVGTAKGVKDGGLLDFAMHAVEIECLPTQIPEHIDVDIAELTIGHSIHVSDLQLPAGVKVLADSRASIVSVLGKAREEEAAPAAV